MAYICHCDICDKIILDTTNDLHLWVLGEIELTPKSTTLFPPQMQICDTCFQMFREEVLTFTQKIQRWRQHKLG